MAPDPWFSVYDSTCQIAQEIAENIQQRNRYERNGETTTKLTVTIRALLQNLKEKIALLKDLLLRAVSTHQMYPCKHFHLFTRVGGKTGFILNKERIGATQIFPQLEEDLFSTILPLILISILSVCYMFYSAVLAKQDILKELASLDITSQGRKLMLPVSCTELFTCLDSFEDG